MKLIKTINARETYNSVRRESQSTGGWLSTVITCKRKENINRDI